MTPNGIVHNLPDHDYHQYHALSSTGVRLLLPEFKGSPKKFQWEKTHKRVSGAFDVGHAVHAKVLGVGLGVITYPDEHLTPSGNVSTSKATVAWAAEQRAAGLTIVSPGELEAADAMAEAVLEHPSARPLFEVATGREVSVFADIDGVPVRARFDALSEETRRGILAVDLKTAPDATPNGFTRSVSRWGYEVQQAHYEDTYKAATGRPVDEFWFVAVEKSAPYEVGVHRLEPYWVDMGRTKAATARRLFTECQTSGVWPGYDPTPTTLTAPAWAVIEHDMQYDNEEITF